VGPKYFHIQETRRWEHADIPRVPRSVACKATPIPTTNISSPWHVQKNSLPRYASGYANYMLSIGVINAYINDIPRYPFQQFDILSKRNLNAEKAYQNVDRVAPRNQKYLIKPRRLIMIQRLTVVQRPTVIQKLITITISLLRGQPSPQFLRPDDSGS
jgi:hypothetical protein